jgi:hypothetical protein
MPSMLPPPEPTDPTEMNNEHSCEAFPVPRYIQFIIYIVHVAYTFEFQSIESNTTTQGPTTNDQHLQNIKTGTRLQMAISPPRKPAEIQTKPTHHQEEHT